MEVQKICISLPIDTFNTDIEVYLPKSGTETDTFPAASSDYAVIYEPTDSCTQTFSYVMSNAGVQPEELTIDPETGIFTMEKDYESKSIFELDLIIDTTGGVAAEQLIIPSIIVSVVCDDHSTDITAPNDLKIKSKASFQYDYNLAVDGAFESSNPLCPIVSHTISAGFSDYDLTNDGIGSEFEIVMKQDLVTVGEYYYTIIATAEGGATEEVESYMSVDDSNPAPIVDPTASFETTAGIALERFSLGNAAVPFTNVNEGDGISYVSGIKTCKESADSTTIVGLQFTMTSSTSGNKFEQEFEGTEGECDPEQAIVLSGADCL